MRFFGAISAWVLSGAAFGVVFSLVAITVSFSPRRIYKPDLIRIWGILLAMEYAVIALVIGAIVFLIFRKSIAPINIFAQISSSVQRRH
jgi:hypothetical protein